MSAEAPLVELVALVAVAYPEPEAAEEFLAALALWREVPSSELSFR